MQVEPKLYGKPARKISTRKLGPLQQLITNLVDPNRFGERGFWPREMKIAKKLFGEYDSKFLLWVSPPYSRRVASLAYFVADYGKKYLEAEAKSEQYHFFLTASTDLSPKVETVSLEEAKIGEDVVVEKKPSTLKDFLNLYN